MFLYPLRPSKYVKYTATMTYGICHTPLFGFICSSSVELAYRKSGTSTVLGFYMKRLLFLACVILDQENLCNFTRNCIDRGFSLFLRSHFLFIHCTRLFIHAFCTHVYKGWGSSVRVGMGGARTSPVSRPLIAGAEKTHLHIISVCTRKNKWNKCKN